MARALFLSACIMALCGFAFVSSYLFADSYDPDDTIADTRHVDDETSQTAKRQKRSGSGQNKTQTNEAKRQKKPKKPETVMPKLVVTKEVVKELQNFEDTKTRLTSISSARAIQYTKEAKDIKKQFMAGNVTKEVWEAARKCADNESYVALQDCIEYMEAIRMHDWAQRMFDGRIPKNGGKKQDVEVAKLYAKQAKAYAKSRDQIAINLQAAVKAGLANQTEADSAKIVAAVANNYAFVRFLYAQKAKENAQKAKEAPATAKTTAAAAAGNSTAAPPKP